MMPIAAASNELPNASRPNFPQDHPGLLCAAFAVLMVAATTLRFLFLARKPFWFDECFSVAAARLNWPNFLHLLWWRESNMSLYYVLLRAWLHFGGTPFWIRTLSLIFSVVALPAIYWLARLLFDQRVAMISAVLLSVNAYHVRYAQEARSYSLFFLLAVLSSGCFFVYLQKPSQRRLQGYILTSALAVYAHFYALLLIGTHALAFCTFDRGTTAAESPNPDRRADIIGRMRRVWLLIAFAVSPLLVFIAKTGAGPIRWIQRPNLHTLISYFEQQAGNNGWPLLALYAVACGIAIFPIRKHLLLRNFDGYVWRVQFLLLWLLLPVALTVLLSFARPLFLPRYFIFCLPPFIILAAAGLARLQKTWQLIAALLVIVAFSLQGVRPYYDHDFDLERDGMNAATALIEDQSQAGDRILFYIPETRAAYEVQRSFAAPAGVSSIKPGPEIIYPHHTETLDYRDFTGKPSIDFLRSVPAQFDRVWVVLMNNGVSSHDGGTPHPDATTLMLSEILGASLPAMQTWQFPQVEVRLYQKHSSSDAPKSK